jgi:hypothetical protein
VLAVTCVVLTVMTLVTFIVAGGGGGARPPRESAAAKRSEGARAITLEVPFRRAGEPPVATAGPGTRPTLSSLLVSTMPAGYVELSSPAGPSGPFDLDGFVETSPHPDDDRSVLSAHGFREGFARSWKRSGAEGTSRIVVSVFAFPAEEGARALTEYENARSVREDGAVAIPVAGGVGYRFVHREAGDIVHGYGVSLIRDGLLFYIGAFYPTPHPPDEVLRLARAQLVRLA